MGITKRSASSAEPTEAAAIPGNGRRVKSMLGVILTKFGTVAD